jgi:hypothetical protein
MLSNSSPSTVATGHKDVTPAWYVLSEETKEWIVDAVGIALGSSISTYDW